MYDYLEGELSFMRSLWREKANRGLYLSDYWRVSRVRAWYQWALGILEARGPAAGRIKNPRKKRRRAID